MLWDVWQRGVEVIKSCIVWLSLLSFLGLVVLVCVWLSWPYVPVRWIESPLPVGVKDISPGEAVPVRFHFVRNTTVPASTTVHMVGKDFVITLPSLEGRVLEKGEFDFVSLSCIVPPHTPEGEYRLKYAFTYPINPLRNIVIPLWSEGFRVVKGPGK